MISAPPVAVDQIRLKRARPQQYPVVEAMFGALHTFNAALDHRFALADGWQTILRDHFERTCTDPGALWIIAWAADQPAGLLLMEAHHDSPLFRDRRWAELVALYVEPQFRSLSVAQCLAKEARAWAASNGFDRIQLYVTATNERARSFYRRAGFRPVQEIWRLDVDPDPAAIQPSDPSCADTHCGADVLEPGHHHLAMEQS